MFNEDTCQFNVERRPDLKISIKRDLLFKSEEALLLSRTSRGQVAIQLETRQLPYAWKASVTMPQAKILSDRYQWGHHRMG